MRCINIDWLEVFCTESGDMGPEYYKGKGYMVKTREYGTPIYRQMFTIFDKYGNEWIEVRRLPYSTKDAGGIFVRGACHLRLTNYACYTINPVGDLIDFMDRHNYTFHNISRIDLCGDFTQFDNGMMPYDFMKDYICGKYSKLNQCNLTAHGRDKWEGREWNSLKWGSETSTCSTKLYNKSLEMKQKKFKSYIWDAWNYAGLDTSKDIWRLEFSLHSQVKSMVAIDTGNVFDISISNFMDRQKVGFAWFALCDRLFDVRVKKTSKNGNEVRKSRCPKLNLFLYAKDYCNYKPTKNPSNVSSTRTIKVICNRLQSIIDNKSVGNRYREAASELYSFFMAQNSFVKGNDLALTLHSAEFDKSMMQTTIKAYESEIKRLRDCLFCFNAPF